MANDFSPAVVEARIQAAIRPQLSHADRLIREYRKPETPPAVHPAKLLGEQVGELARIFNEGMRRFGEGLLDAFRAPNPPAAPVPADDHAVLW